MQILRCMPSLLLAIIDTLASSKKPVVDNSVTAVTCCSCCNDNNVINKNISIKYYNISMQYFFVINHINHKQ